MIEPTKNKKIEKKNKSPLKICQVYNVLNINHSIYVRKQVIKMYKNDIFLTLPPTPGTQKK